MAQYYNNVEFAIWTSWGFGGIMSTIDERKQYLLSHPEISLVPPLISNVSVNNNLVEANVFNASSVELMITSSQYNSKFQSFAMNDDGINGDLTPNDGIYTIQIPFSGNTNVKFYKCIELTISRAATPETKNSGLYFRGKLPKSMIFSHFPLLFACFPLVGPAKHFRQGLAHGYCSALTRHDPPFRCSPSLRGCSGTSLGCLCVAGPF